MTYIRVGRLASPIALLGLKVYTVITRRARVRVLVTNERGEALLVRGVVSHGEWSLPGGGMKRQEAPIAAARRELFEETGIDLSDSQLRYIRTLTRRELSIPFDAPLFHATAKRSALSENLYNPREIIAAEWFATDDLPEPLSSIAKAAITDFTHIK